MLEKIAHVLTRKPRLVAAIALLLLIPSLLGIVGTRINYDILTYLPPDMDSSKGEALLEEPFHMAATTMLIVEDMPRPTATTWSGRWSRCRVCPAPSGCRSWRASRSQRR